MKCRRKILEGAWKIFQPNSLVLKEGVRSVSKVFRNWKSAHFGGGLTSVARNSTKETFKTKCEKKTPPPPKVECTPLPQVCIGESPYWNSRTQTLYMVDINERTILSYRPGKSETGRVTIDVPFVTFVTSISGKNDYFIIGAGNSLQLVQWDGVSSKPDCVRQLHTLPQEPEGNRTNDGKADPAGRLWFGTMRICDPFQGKDGGLYSFTVDESSKKHVSGVGISNGLCWDKKKNVMYYIDSAKYTVDAFDYKSCGSIGNRRVVFDFKKTKMKSFPDGQTIDSEGKLWVACFGESKVIRLDPDCSKILREVPIPTPNVTALAWGGDDLSDLYVTTAASACQMSGRTFRISGTGVKGLPMDEFKLWNIP